MLTRVRFDCVTLYVRVQHANLTPWNSVLESLLVTPSRNSPPFMVSEGSLPCWEESATGPYPEPDESSSHLPTLFL